MFLLPRSLLPHYSHSFLRSHSTLKLFNMPSSNLVSPGYLFVKPLQDTLSIETKLSGKIVQSESKFASSIYSGQFEFHNSTKQSDDVTRKENTRPILIISEDQVSKKEFQFDNSIIPTKILIYFDIIHSTQILLKDLLAQIPEIDNSQICITSNRQVCGRGRKEGREWQSPVGCAMFSFNYCIGGSAAFLSGGRNIERIGFVQHLACLSIIRAIEFLFEPIGAAALLDDFKIKWPNDVYYKNKKIAGLIMNASHDSSTNSFNVILGIGINVGNDEPTDCLNRILERDVANFSTHDKLTTEQVIGRVISEFNDFLNLISLYPDSFSFVKKQYEMKWLHSNQIALMPNHGSVKVIGVNDCGYLIAERESDKQTIVLGPEMEEVHLDLPSSHQ